MPDDSTPAIPAATPPDEAANAPGMSPAECGRRLAELFPALFGGPPRPLKLRVHVDIQARAPGTFTKPVLAAFMRRHTGSTAYLQAVARGSQRFGLDGEAAGEISAEHRQAAVDELARRRARHAEQRAQEDQARRARLALLRDFERTTLTEANFCALKGIAPDALQGLLEQARREALEAPPQPARHEGRPPRHGRREEGGAVAGDGRRSPDRRPGASRR
jgi:hypothetical protein